MFNGNTSTRAQESPLWPKPVAMALNALWAAGYEAYPVGGCVRDSLLGLQPGDWDICTNARPEQTERVFAQRRVIETGMQHGTVTVLIDGMPLEITTFRVESGYSDSRHPDSVAFVGDLREDLTRRDFTINAMALDREGAVIDPFGGQNDLRAGVIRCVGEPAERFGEDALRILRALRFASRFRFAIEPATAAAIRQGCGQLEHVSRERVFSELRGILVGAGAGELLRALPEAIFAILPELRASHGFKRESSWQSRDVWTHTTMAVEAVAPEPVLRLAMLLHDMGAPACSSADSCAAESAQMAEVCLRRLRCDNATRVEVVRLIELHDTEPSDTRPGARRLLTKLGEPSFRRLIQCWRADAADCPAPAKEQRLEAIDRAEALLDTILHEESCFSLRQLAVSGGDLLALGMEPGPALGRQLQELFRLVTEEDVPNEREILLKYVMK